MLPKLVRDMVPKNIVADGKIPVCQYVDELNVEPYIFNKIREEVAELQYECTGIELSKEKILEEFADVYEILDKLRSLYKIDDTQLRSAMTKKRNLCGAFDDNIVLLDIVFKKEDTNDGKI